MDKRISVRAKSSGFYRDRTIERGDIFSIEERLFSAAWMEKMPPTEPQPEEPKSHPAPAYETERINERIEEALS